MDLSNVIKRPVITEKTLGLTAEGKFTFAVDKKASKKQVKKAVEEFFKVNVLKVWLTTVRGKEKRVGKMKRKKIQTPDLKKAIVKLAKDQKIDLFEAGQG